MSVVLPVRDAAGTLGRAIESIRQQRERHWELIVVDDGSVDGSAAVAAREAGEDGRIRVLRRERQGLVPALEAGLAVARAPYLARMDADDVSAPARLGRQADALDAEPGWGLVSCRVRFAGDRRRAAGYARHVDWANRAVIPEAIARDRFIDLPVPHPTLMFRREVLSANGGYRDGAFPEDYELVLRWMSRGVGVGKVDEELVDWHDDPDRLSRRDARYAREAFDRCKAPYLARAIRDAGAAGRELWVWGAGRPSRKAARWLESAWRRAAGYIDVDPRKIGRRIAGRPVVSPADLPPRDQAVIVSYVGSLGARERIRAMLDADGRRETLEYWIAA